MTLQKINCVQKHLGHFPWKYSLNAHESLWHRSSPLPQYCLPFVFRLALTGQSTLGFRIMLKICFPVHRAMGWWADSMTERQTWVTSAFRKDAHHCALPLLSLGGGGRSWPFHLCPQELRPKSDKLLICQRTCPSTSRDMLLEIQQHIHNFHLLNCSTVW